MEIKPSPIPSRFFKLPRQVLHFVGIPLFYFFFLIIYKPFDAEQMLTLKYGGFAFNVAITTAILLLVLVGTRLMMWSLRKVVEYRFYIYVLWCIGEIIIAALLVALYITLISGRDYHYLDAVPYAMLYLSSIAVYPYIIFFLILKASILEHPVTEDGTLLRFCDDKNRLKFVVDPSQVMYVQSDENYCIIHYVEGGKHKVYSLRCTISKMEEKCAPFNIVRCHRSYCVNMNNVQGMRKEADKTNVLELNVAGLDTVPVSERYSAKVSELL